MFAVRISLLRLLPVLLVAIASITAHAQTISIPASGSGGVTLEHLGTQGWATAPYSVAFFNVKEATEAAGTKGCYVGEYFVDTSTAFGKQTYNGLLAAYAIGRKLRRVDFAKDGAGICWVSLIIIEQ